MKKFLVATAALFVLFKTTLPHANEDILLDEARKVAMALPPKLIVSLQDEIGRSGLEGAIPICKNIAPKLAVEIFQKTGWKIKRVSLKARNTPSAIPDDWERAALEAFDRRAAAGEQPSELEKGAQVGTEYRYVKALPVQTLCLGCHGHPDQLSTEVKSALRQNYPGDEATGYSEGQIRGAISVRKVFP